MFRAIWFASLASNLGGLIQSVGAAWLMTSISASDDMVALVQASTTLPIMIFSLAAGAIADNFDRRKVMLAAQLLMFAVSILLAVCGYLNILNPWLLLVFTFLIGCGTALNNPSWQASVGDMVPRPLLSAAVVLNSVNFNLTRSVGPAIGGIIVATAGAAAAFAVNVLSSCVVPECNGALSILSRQEKDALWEVFFTAAPARRRVFEPSSKRRKRAPGPLRSATD